MLTLEEKRKGLKNLFNEANSTLMAQTKNDSILSDSFMEENESLIQALKANSSRMSSDVQQYVMRILEGLLHLPVDALYSLISEKRNTWQFVKFCVVKATDNPNSHTYPLNSPLICHKDRSRLFCHILNDELKTGNDLCNRMKTVLVLTPEEVNEFVDGLNTKGITSIVKVFGISFAM